MNISPNIPMLEPVNVCNSDYQAALSQAMEELADDPRVVFLGQGVRDSGTFMSTTLQGVPLKRRIELPVMEETQLGMSIGMALTGLVPVSIYPRWNFLILAANQLVNHLDKMGAHVIIRVGVGSSKPLDPGLQHTSDFTAAFRLMCRGIHFEHLMYTFQIVDAYREALRHDGPSVLVEFANYY